jgi:hypothetical protein
MAQTGGALRIGALRPLLDLAPSAPAPLAAAALLAGKRLLVEEVGVPAAFLGSEEEGSGNNWVVLPGMCLRALAARCGVTHTHTHTHTNEPDRMS